MYVHCGKWTLRLRETNGANHAIHSFMAYRYPHSNHHSAGDFLVSGEGY